jgi:hypothetical protein
MSQNELKVVWLMLKGKLIGRPTTTIEDVPVAVTKAYELSKSSKINKSECARMCNISRSCLKKIKLNDEIKTEVKPKEVDNTENDEVQQMQRVLILKMIT